MGGCDASFNNLTHILCTCHDGSLADTGALTEQRHDQEQGRGWGSKKEAATYLLIMNRISAKSSSS